METTLALLRRENEILFGEKKRGFGKGKFNGVGGKIEQGETVEEAMIRETYEEIGVRPTKFEKVGEITFDEMYKGDLGYFTVTMDSDDCLECGYHGIIDNACPKCGCADENRFVRVRRITGYLSGAPRKSLYSSWNSGKLAELKYRKNI